MNGNNGTGTINIDKLLEERAKIHGDAETTHRTARQICNILMKVSNLSEAGEELMRMVILKCVRGATVPTHADHFNDIGGYAELIRRVECGDGY